LECLNGLHRSIVKYESRPIHRKTEQSFNLETHLAFLDYLKACGEAKREKLFEIQQSKYTPNLLLKM
jgi:hypothetical protein